MPLVRISLLKGKPREYLRALSDGVHRALVEAYGVPPDDRFHLIHQHEPEEFICDAGYLGIRRPQEAVFVHVTAGRWRDTATKQGFYRRLAQILAEDPGLRPEDVQVILSPNDRDDWSFGNGVAAYVDAAGPG
jgi:phenylpyruvate tautomerase PptA (4-oxalocrotonate tautomerase family)